MPVPHCGDGTLRLALCGSDRTPALTHRRPAGSQEYCASVIPPDEPAADLRVTYVCGPCKLQAVCEACAKQCHRCAPRRSRSWPARHVRGV